MILIMISILIQMLKFQKLIFDSPGKSVKSFENSGEFAEKFKILRTVVIISIVILILISVIIGFFDFFHPIYVRMSVCSIISIRIYS